jgi:hypothetical protein
MHVMGQIDDCNTSSFLKQQPHFMMFPYKNQSVRFLCK